MYKQSRTKAPNDAGPNAFLLRWGVFLAGGLIVLAALGSYHNSFSGAFVYDDVGSITENPTIRHLWPVWKVLSPPRDLTVGGRPLVNLSLALNYALSGEAVWSYHALNLLIHILAGLALFGLVRRTLVERPTSNIQHPTSKANHSLDVASSPRAISHGLSPAEALPLALVVALLWTVHPLQTESVTYIIQRAESLMGLFYLLTLYCFIRGAESRIQASGIRHQAPGVRKQEKELKTQNPRAALPLSPGLTPDASRLPVLRSLGEGGWFTASVFFCFLGMASKEVMVSAPLMVLLYDRTFVAGSFRSAWQQRRRLYLGLACTWLLLGYLVAATGSRGGTAGFGSGSAWAYALTQFPALVHYLRLSVWPQPLVFDYGRPVLQQIAEVTPYAAVIVLLLALTVVGLWRYPALGFLGAWFFAILAPSSSVVPVVTETMAEHRMYLPLAAVITILVFGLHALLGRRSVMVCMAAVAGLGWLSMQRNKNYQGEVTLWSDTVAKCPDNVRAHNNLGTALLKVPGRLPDAIAQYQAALQINPDLVETHNNLGAALLKMPERLPDAIAQYQAALRIKPDSAEAHDNLGTALLKMPGQLPDAIVQYEAALRINPGYAEAHYHLGNAWAKLPGHLPDAVVEYETALRINPDSVETHVNLGTVLLELSGRVPDAIAQFQAALRIDPNDAEAHNNLGNALFNLPGRLPEAIAQYQAALRINPNSVNAHYNLGAALLKMPGRLPDAIVQLKAALRLKPDLVPAQEMLNRLQNPPGSKGATEQLR